MHRIQSPENQALEALFDERDHLKIRISLLLDADPTDDRKIVGLYDRLEDVEQRIVAAERAIAKAGKNNQRET